MTSSKAAWSRLVWRSFSRVSPPVTYSSRLWVSTSSWPDSASSPASSSTDPVASISSCSVVSRCCPSMTFRAGRLPVWLSWACTTTAPRKWVADEYGSLSRSSASRRTSCHKRQPLLGLVPHVRPLEQRDDQVLRQVEDVQRGADVGLHVSPFETRSRHSVRASGSVSSF